MQQTDEHPELLAGLVVFSANGIAQFGWQNLETGAFYAEDDGHCIMNVVGSVLWPADISH